MGATEAETLTIHAPADVMAGVHAEARRMGLEPAAYLLLLHAMRHGQGSATFLSGVREVFTQDRDILAKLAE
jgi:hypothetical protein